MFTLSEMTISNREVLVEPVLKFIELTAIALNLPASGAARLRIVCENIINKCIHKNHQNEGRISISILLNHALLEVRIQDLSIPWGTGQAFLDQDTTATEKHSLLYVVDKVALEMTEHGQCAIFQMYLPNQLIESKQWMNVASKEMLDINFQIVQTDINQREQVLQTISCIYGAYGALDVCRGLYYTRNFIALSQSGILQTFLAVNDHGQIGGHIAVIRVKREPSLAVLYNVIIGTAFRGLQLSERLLQTGFQVAQNMDVHTIMVQPTALHGLTQHICYQLGFCATGFLFHHAKLNTKTGSHAWLDCAIAAYVCDHKTSVTIYPPQEHSEFISKMYTALKRPISIGTAKLPESQGTVQCYIDNLASTARLVVDKTPVELHKILNTIMEHCRSNEIEMVELYINLGDPACETAYRIAKTQNFLFCGIHPGGLPGDYLFMQHLMGHPIDFSAICVQYDYANVLSYIKDQIKS